MLKHSMIRAALQGIKAQKMSRENPMIFSRAISFVSLLTIFLTFSFVAGNPLNVASRGSDVAAFEKRQTDNTDVLVIVQTLQSQVGTILPQLSKCHSFDTAIISIHDQSTTIPITIPPYYYR
jgi:hypothetical protein